MVIEAMVGFLLQLNRIERKLGKLDLSEIVLNILVWTLNNAYDNNIEHLKQKQSVNWYEDDVRCHNDLLYLIYFIKSLIISLYY